LISLLHHCVHAYVIKQRLDIPGVLKKRSNASNDIEKHRAKRKTPLISAASISALCHP
jgi:hypothetical protein